MTATNDNTWTSADVARICGLRNVTQADNLALRIGLPRVGRGHRRHWTLHDLVTVYVTVALTDGTGIEADQERHLPAARYAADRLSSGARYRYLIVAGDEHDVAFTATGAIETGRTLGTAFRIVPLDALLEGRT